MTCWGHLGSPASCRTARATCSTCGRGGMIPGRAPLQVAIPSQVFPKRPTACIRISTPTAIRRCGRMRVGRVSPTAMTTAPSFAPGPIAKTGSSSMIPARPPGQLSRGADPAPRCGGMGGLVRCRHVYPRPLHQYQCGVHPGRSLCGQLSGFLIAEQQSNE